MTEEEIKEILDLLKRCDNTYLKIENSNGEKEYEYHQVNDLRLDGYHSQLLLDYITNLQKKYENALKVNQNSHKYITELEMNNAILKEDLDKANDTIEKDRQFYKCRMDEYVEYKSRCEKANTYINEEIKKIQEHQYSTGVRRLNKIQNILNGSDEK